MGEVTSSSLVTGTRIYMKPHIQNKLDLLWGTLEGKQYLEELMLPDRLNRQGFTPSEFRELMQIAHKHRAEFPELYPVGIWDHNYKR